MADYTTRVTRGDLFSIFLRAGLAFGGGLGILAVLEQELVNKRLLVHVQRMPELVRHELRFDL